ncbi:MAG: hypothetical protein ACTHM8_07810 [Sphingomonas sp.]
MAGVIEQGSFRPLSIAPPPTAPGVPSLVPLDSDILPLARHRTFGVEGRVKLSTTAKGIEIACAAGDRPAGVMIDWPDHHLPQGYAGAWSVVGAGKALGLSAVRAGDDAPSRAEARLGSSSSLAFDGARNQLVVTCPPSAANGRIDSVAIGPAAIDARPRARGTWVWDARIWRENPDHLAELAARAGWSELAVQLPAAPGPALVRLADALRRKNITLRLLDGDPAMATAAGTAAAAARFAAWSAWCDQQWGRAERPRLELDIEPYGRADFARDPFTGWRDWADAIDAIATAWGEPFTVDVPWWMNRSASGEAALNRAGTAIGAVVVMAYRTEPQLIVDAAAPWLADGRWPVRIAIETGPVAREATRRYRRAERGTLSLDGEGAVLFDQPVAASQDAAVFRLVGEQITDPTRVSFHDRPAKAVAAENIVGPILSGWQSYSGWRVHGWSTADAQESL